MFQDPRKPPQLVCKNCEQNLFSPSPFQVVWTGGLAKRKGGYGLQPLYNTTWELVQRGMQQKCPWCSLIAEGCSALSEMEHAGRLDGREFGIGAKFVAAKKGSLFEVPEGRNWFELDVDGIYTQTFEVVAEPRECFSHHL